MWQLDVSPVMDNSQQTPVPRRLEAGLAGQPGKLVLQAEHELSVAENTQYLVCVLGRLRPYHQDYGLPQPAEWLLACLEEKGERFYSAIAGFFALLVLDKQTGALRLVTDHVGSVPLYLVQQAGGYRVTDSLKLIEPELEPENRTLNPQAIFNYCFYHCIPASRGIYADVQKLKPGTELRVQASGERQEPSRSIAIPGPLRTR